MFDFADYLSGAVDVRVRVECIPHGRDDEHPIRLVIVGPGDVELTELRFTPTTADDTAGSIARLLSSFMPAVESWRIADGLRFAAIKVWASRN